MPRFGHLDQTLTKEARKSGRFLDKRSMVLRRMDGSYRIVLFGMDKVRLRVDCFLRDSDQCVDRRKSPCHGWLELSHDPPMSKSEGSDVLEQVFCRCVKHHRELDLHGEDGHF
jgi:hypothetical protein